MLDILRKRLALSNKGARDFLKGTFFTTMLNLALMLPAVFVFIFLDNYLNTSAGVLTSAGRGLGYYLFLGVGFMAVMYIIARLQYRSTYTTIYDESANRRIHLAEKLRKLPLAFFGEKNLSDLTSTIMEDNTSLEHTFSHAVPQLVASVISIVLVATGLFFYNWRMAVALFWVIPLAAGILILARKLINRENKTSYAKKRDITEYIQEGLETVQEIKAYNKEEEYITELSERIDIYERQQIRGELLTGGLVNSAQSFLKLGLASVVIVGCALLTSGKIDLFMYLVFLMVASRIYNPVEEVFINLAALFYLDVRINRMKEMNALPVQNGTSDFNPGNYDIVFENVDFSYENGKQVLSNVSFSARQGEITALVGPSGGGKSTSAKLAARFWDVNGGKILLGGRNISEIDPETLLKNYSVVFQDVVLFNTSVMDNIRIGRRDATDEEVLQVAKSANCDEFAEKLPQGYETVIGENGETLSGGERQRISIARALLKNAPIVLLDEATASLDVENETKIQKGILELVRGRTVLLIAHRMRTVANADKIIVLDRGKVVEQGTPDQLREKNGMFARMLQRQMG